MFMNIRKDMPMGRDGLQIQKRKGTFDGTWAMEDNWKSHNGEWDKEHLGSKSVISNNSGFQGNGGLKKGKK